MDKDSAAKNILKSPDVLSAVQLAVDGMTCLARVRTITDAVSEIESI